MININRANKAMHRVDPEKKIRWYITAGGTDCQLEGQINYNGTCIQSSVDIYGHSSKFDKYFEEIYNKLMKLKEALIEG